MIRCNVLGRGVVSPSATTAPGSRTYAGVERRGSATAYADPIQYVIGTIGGRGETAVRTHLHDGGRRRPGCGPGRGARIGGHIANIVFILTDDQRWDELSHMPNVGNLIQAKGVTFDNSFVSNSL